MPSQEPIKVSVADARERKRRQREFILAAAAFTAVAGLAWVELKYLGVDSHLFMGLFVFVFILLLLILFIVLRNMVKLLIERRRKVLGSKLKTRLVVAFMILSLVPTVLMFLVGVKFVQTSVDYWFKLQVENSLEQALEVGQAFYASSRQRLVRRGQYILDSVRDQGLAWGGKTMDEMLTLKMAEYDLTLLGVLSPDAKEQNWHAQGDWETGWPEEKARINFESLTERPEVFSAIRPGPRADMVLAMLPVDEGNTGYLVVGENIGQGLMYKLDQIVRGLGEYKKLRTMKYPLKVALYMMLGILTMLIMFGAMWFGFRLAKELTAPVEALALGTERIAKGDLTVRLEDQSVDEIGLLVQSFNSMASDLQKSREDYTRVNLRLEMQNRELEARGTFLEAILDNVTAGVISLDGQGRVSTVNKAAEAMLGLDVADVLGRRPLELLTGRFRDMVQEVLGQLETSPGSQWQRQMDLVLGSRELKLLVNVVALPTPEGGRAGLVAVFEDVTELEKMQRLAAWREVARRIAHEIKNPLTPIKLSAQRIERKFAGPVDDPVLEQLTGTIVRQVEHLQQMVQEFSTFAKLPEVDLRPDYPATLLEEVVEDFRNSHTAIEWDVRFETQLPQVKMDREGIRRVLINILTNAAEALAGRDNARVEVVAAHDAMLGWVRLEIRDNGPGLSEEERSRLFEPYFSRKKGGTGLGLTIVKSIVSDHHGYVRANPNHPSGTVVVVELPA